MKNIYFHGMRFYFYCSLFIVSLSLGLEKLLVTGSEGFPGGSAGKESACNAGDVGLIPGLGRSPGEGNGNPLQYSCLENSTDRGAWQAEVHGVTKSQTQMSKHAHTHASMHSLSRDQPSFLAKMKYTMEGSNSPE